MTQQISDRRKEFDMPGRPPGGHYSAAVAAGGFVFVAGQTPRDENRKLIGETIEEQTHATLDNVERILVAAGASLNDVVKVSVYLTDLALFRRFNSVYASRFTETKPVRTTVECGLQGVMIEIDVIAYVASDATPPNSDTEFPGWPFKIESAQ